MIIKQLIDEDFVNYKKPSMFIAFPSCTFKCEKECGQKMCQNSDLMQSPNIEITTSDLVYRYLSNPITSAMVCGGLEPFDSWEDLYELIAKLRQQTEDDVVIYTGYKENELKHEISKLSLFPNIFVKFGRFVPNQQKHYDSVLGINLASDNQYGVQLSNKGEDVNEASKK
jgi:organic radical activating enzyme